LTDGQRGETERVAVVSVRLDGEIKTVCGTKQTLDAHVVEKG